MTIESAVTSDNGATDASVSSARKRSLVSACAAFCAYGGWGFYANIGHELQPALMAALTQGSYSFGVTLCMTLVMEWLFHQSQHPVKRFVVTVITTCLLLYSTSWGINALAGTPEIFLTILPGAIIGTLYTLAYTLMLSRAST